MRCVLRVVSKGASLVSFAIFLMWSGLAGALIASESQISIIRIMGQAPGIDGNLEEPAWQNVSWLDSFTRMNAKGEITEWTTRAKMFHDQYFLYVALMAKELDPARKDRKYSKVIWNDDCAELFLATGGNLQRYYHVIVNPAGSLYAEEMLDNNTGRGVFIRNPEWSPPVRAAATRSTDGWIVEMAIPFAALRLEARGGDGWNVNIARGRANEAGRMEYASLAQMTGDKLGVPQEWLPAILRDFSEKPFALDIAEGSTTVVRRDNALWTMIELPLSNRTGSFLRLQGQATAISSTGERVASEVVAEEIAVNETKSLRFSLPLKQPGKHSLQIELFRQQAGRKPLKYVMWEKELHYQPLRISLREPAYRNSIFASQPRQRVVAHVTRDSGIADATAFVALCGADGKTVQSATPDLAAGGRVEFHVADLATGDYELVAQLANSEIPAQRTRIRKLAPQAGEVWLNEAGVVHVDGQPFLPFGWFSGPLSRQTAVNTVQTYTPFPSIEKALAFLDEAGRNGLKVIMYPYQELRNDWKMEIFDLQKSRHGTLKQEQRGSLERFVNAVKHHPALLAWYVADEPENENANPEWFVQVKQYLTELDPYHPCIMTNRSLAGIRRYHGGGDILMPDEYPNYIVGREPLSPLWMTAEITRQARQFVPTWFIPQAFCYDRLDRNELNCRPPTLGELRNQIHQSFASGGSGILMFSYLHWSLPYEVLRKAPEFIGAELQNAKKELLSALHPDLIGVDLAPADKNFIHALRGADGEYALIAANTGNRRITVNFSMSTKGITTLYQQSSRREFPLIEGKFRDVFEPYESKIYLTSKQKAQATDLSAFEAELATAESARRKPGNLVAIGPLTVREYRDLNQPGEHLNFIATASSCVRHYHASKTNANSLYFLFDGLADQEPWLAWKPDPADSAPWLKIKFKKISAVGRVKLSAIANAGKLNFTGCDILAVVDGKRVTLAQCEQPEQQLSEFSFSPVMTDEVEIRFRKQGNNSGCILSEIEIYSE